MTEKEFLDLNSGDVIESNKNGNRKVVIEAYSKETITQVTKTDLIHTFKEYTIIVKANK